MCLSLAALLTKSRQLSLSHRIGLALLTQPLQQRLLQASLYWLVPHRLVKSSRRLHRQAVALSLTKLIEELLRSLALHL